VKGRPAHSYNLATKKVEREWSFHPKVKTEAERETKIRAIFGDEHAPSIRD
jgi:hypothetical protein